MLPAWLPVVDHVVVGLIQRALHKGELADVVDVRPDCGAQVVSIVAVVKPDGDGAAFYPGEGHDCHPGPVVVKVLDHSEHESEVLVRKP